MAHFVLATYLAHKKYKSEFLWEFEILLNYQSYFHGYRGEDVFNREVMIQALIEVTKIT